MKSNKSNDRVIMWVPPEFKNAFTIERIRKGYRTNMQYARELSKDSGFLEKTLKTMKEKKEKRGGRYKPFL